MSDPWVIWISLFIICVLPCCLALRTSNDPSRTTHLRLMTKSGESEALPRRGTAIRENEIAAIFRGVAYGAPTQARPNITTPTSFITFSSTPASYPSQLPGFSINGENSNHPVTYSDPIFEDGDGHKNVISRPNNYTSFVNKDIHDEKGIVGSQEYTNSAIFSISTYTPLPTNQTVQHIITSDNQTYDIEVKGTDGGVWITSTTDSQDLRLSLGLAWWLQVYVSVGLFTLLAIVTLCLMARFAVATHLLPRPYYLILHILIFFTTFLRSVHTLNDAHGMKHLLPVALLTVVKEIIWPCLTAAIAVITVSVLKSWRYPRHPHLAMALAVITALHLITLTALHLMAEFLKEEYILLEIASRVLAVAWGGTVGFTGMWAVWQESKSYSSHLTDVRLNSSPDNYPNAVYSARLVLASTVTQLLLSGLNLYTLFVPISPESHIWVWWCCICVSRGLELLVGSTLLSAAALTLTKPRQCFTFSTCCQKRTVEIIHPAEIKMIHPMGVYTLQPARPKNEHAQTIAALSLSNPHKEKRNHSSLDYVTSDFQLVWNHNRHRPGVASNVLAQHVNANDIPRTHILPVAPRNVMEPFVSANAFSSTLPKNRMYASPPSCLQFEEEIKNSRDQGINYTSKSSTLLSGSSGSSKMYSSPQIPLRTSRSWDELSTGHVYEDPMKAKPGSVDEGLSDLSDMNSDNINDLFFSESGSPVLLRPTRRSRRRHNTACYISARHFTAHPPTSLSSSVMRNEQEDKHVTKTFSKKSLTRQFSTQVPNNLPVSPTQGSKGDYDSRAPVVLQPPVPFLSDAQNTSPHQCVAIHPSSAQISSTRLHQSGLTRSKTKSKSDHIEEY